MKILIVEDDNLIAMHLKYLVTELDHAVCAIARDADSAVVQGAFHRPDVALMDLRLADGTSGRDAAQGLHENYKIRCIFISGNLDENTRIGLVPFDPVDFVDKPVELVCLERALKKLM